MSRNKSEMKKQRLAKAARQRKARVPIFVVAKTNRKITRNPKARSWRTSKLKIKDD